MQLGTTVALIIIAILILVNAFFSAAEIAVVSVRKSRLRQLAEERDRRARAALRLTENPSRLLATVQVGVTLAGFFASALGAITIVAVFSELLHQVPYASIANASGAISLAVVTVFIAYLTLVFGELIPKTLAIQRAEGIALAVARPIEIIAAIVSPLILILTGTSNAILRGLGLHARAALPSVTEDEILSMIDAGEEEGVVQPLEADMIQGVFDFGDAVAREVMVPRTDMVAIDKDASLQEAVELMLRGGYSRVPVFEETLDNMIGILYAKDLLRHYSGKQRVRGVSELMRPVTFIPESKRLAELFKELQRSRIHMVIVVDEYGGTAGLVTLEDLLEEIVGEIQDEYDKEEKSIEVLSPSELAVSGRVSLDAVNELLDLSLAGEGFDSVGGLVLSELGRIPDPGDRLDLPEAQLTVLSVEGHRITRVRVVRREPLEGPRDE